MRRAEAKVSTASSLPRGDTAEGLLRTLTGVKPQAVAKKVAELGQGVLLALSAVQRLTRRIDGEVAQLRDRLDEALQQKTGLEASDYVAFEDHFRGSFDEVRKRLSVYDRHFEELKERYPGADVYEIGAGRGEMADLIRSFGFRYACVDVNTAMVERLQSQGVDATAGDGIEALKLRADKSLGAIVAIHVIEHVPFRRAVELFQLAAAKLRPGGLLVLETPNALSLTSLMSFPLDPTHLRPLHPLALQFLAARNGFDLLRSETMHSPETLKRLPDDAPNAEVHNHNVDRLNAVLFAGHDFVFVARRRSDR